MLACLADFLFDTLYLLLAQHPLSLSHFFVCSRCDDYVYVPSTPKCFKQLDKHVDSVEHDIKLPLVVLGEPGNKPACYISPSV